MSFLDMSVLDKPSTTIAALAFGILVFGAGLTSPIWLIIAGDNPIQAIQGGTPVVIGSILGLVITVILGLVAARLRKPLAISPLTAADIPPRNSALVHVVVMLMFVIPFLTIILGYVLKRMIDFDAG